MKPTTCAAIAPNGYDRRGTETILTPGRSTPVSIDAIASREMSSAISTGAGARGFACGAASRSQTSIASSPFMPSSARSRANTSGFTTPGVPYTL